MLTDVCNRREEKTAMYKYLLSIPVEPVPIIWAKDEASVKASSRKPIIIFMATSSKVTHSFMGRHE